MEKKQRKPAARQHTVRTKNNGLVTLSINRGKAIKLMCTECSGWGEFDPKGCPSVNCPLFPFKGKTLAAYRSPEKVNG